MFDFFTRKRKRSLPIKSDSQSDDSEGDWEMREQAEEERRQQSIRTARYVDAMAAKRREKEAEQRLMNNKNRKIKFNLEITPKDQVWQQFQKQLLSSFSEYSIFDQFAREYYEPAQILSLIPAPRSGVILDYQKQHIAEYEKLLNEKRFRRVPDNLLTKLTFTHFGLPVAPLTVQNMIGGIITPHHNDPADHASEADLSTIFTEDELYFWATNNAESYGYQIIRKLSLSCL
jgi:hypothetical protein